MHLQTITWISFSTNRFSLVSHQFCKGCLLCSALKVELAPGEAVKYLLKELPVTQNKSNVRTNSPIYRAVTRSREHYFTADFARWIYGKGFVWINDWPTVKCFQRKVLVMGVVAHACNPSHLGCWGRDCEFKASLGNLMGHWLKIKLGSAGNVAQGWSTCLAGLRP